MIEEAKRTLHETWGTTAAAQKWVEHFAPSGVNDDELIAWFAELLRLGASPGAEIARLQMILEIDVRPALATIRVPALVVQRVGDRDATLPQGRYLAEHIPGAQMVELPGDDHMPTLGDMDAVIDAIRSFVETTGPRPELREAATFLSTVVVVDAGEAGAPHLSAAMASAVAQFHGQVLSDGSARAVAAFDGPARAIRFADAMVAALGRAGFGARCGLQTGEVAVDGGRVSGSAVDVARALAQAGRDDQIVATAIVRDLVGGSGIRFEPVSAAQSARVGGASPILLVDRASLR
jgi:hypothetical protein